jgi:hypothetical protein
MVNINRATDAPNTFRIPSSAFRCSAKKARVPAPGWSLFRLFGFQQGFQQMTVWEAFSWCWIIDVKIIRNSVILSAECRQLYVFRMQK